MTSIYILSKFIPLQLGAPVWVFFGVLFSYSAGTVCIAYIFVINTFDLIISIPEIIATSQITKSMIAATPFMPIMPNTFVISVIIAGTYLGTVSAIFVSKTLINKLHLTKKFLYIHT